MRKGTKVSFEVSREANHGFETVFCNWFVSGRYGAGREELKERGALGIGSRLYLRYRKVVIGSIRSYYT
jgi:hypothetical protein